MLRYVLSMALILCVGNAHAGPVNVLQRLPVGGYDYVLHDNGNIFTDNGLFKKQLDDGIGTVQMVGSRDNLFILKKVSEIWWYDGRRWTLVDDYEGTTRLEFAGGACIAHKASGESYRCALAKNEKGEWIADWSKLPAPAAAAAAAPAASSPESSSFSK